FSRDWSSDVCSSDLLLSTGRVTGCQTKLRVAPKGIHNAGNAGKHIIPLRCDMGQKPVVVMYMQLAQKWMFQPFNAAYLLKLMVIGRFQLRIPASLIGRSGISANIVFHC